MPFANDEFWEIINDLLTLYFRRKLNFLIFSILFLRFGKIRCGSLFGLLNLLSKGRQCYGGTIAMYLLYLTKSKPRMG